MLVLVVAVDGRAAPPCARDPRRIERDLIGRPLARPRAMTGPSWEEERTGLRVLSTEGISGKAAVVVATRTATGDVMPLLDDEDDDDNGDEDEQEDEDPSSAVPDPVVVFVTV